MRIQSLHVHPLKSGAVRSLARAEVGPAGLRDDRTWMVVDGTGQMLTGRELSTLFHVVADTPRTDPTVTAALRLRAPAVPGLPDLEVDEPSGGDVSVRMFTRPPMRAREAAGDAGAWIAEATGTPGLRLVWCDDPTRRSLDPRYTRPGDHTAFADGYPVTLATTESLSLLDDQVVGGALERGEEPPAPLTMARFRPNLVVTGAPTAYAEDGWSRVAVGEVELRVVHHVDRCVMTTVDPASLERGAEPIRTLARHRRWDGKVWFCRQLVPVGSGVLSVGDELRVLD